MLTCIRNASFVWLLLAGLVIAADAKPQVTWHRDGKGYTTRRGQATYSIRFDGNSSTHYQAGKTTYHYYRSGVRGSTTYTAAGRWDYWANPQQGWWRSTFTSYRRPSNQQTQQNWQAGRFPRKWPATGAYGNRKQAEATTGSETTPQATSPQSRSHYYRWWRRGTNNAPGDAADGAKRGRRPRRPALDKAEPEAPEAESSSPSDATEAEEA